MAKKEKTVAAEGEEVKATSPDALSTYIFVAGKHYADGKTYVVGDEIELTEAQANGALLNKVRLKD